MKNPVVEFSKPKQYRNRKKHGSKEMQRLEQAKRTDEAAHPRHQPYERPTAKDWLKHSDDE